MPEGDAVWRTARRLHRGLAGQVLEGSDLRVPALGIEVDLVQGLNTVDLPVLEPGTVPFTCVMGMYSGNLVVVDQPTTPQG